MPTNQQLPQEARAALVRLEQQHGRTIGQHDLQTPVTIFFVDWCGFCKQLKKEAEASGNRVTLVNVTPHERSQEITDAHLPGFPIVRIGTDDWQVGATAAARRAINARAAAARPGRGHAGTTAAAHPGRGHAGAAVHARPAFVRRSHPYLRPAAPVAAAHRRVRI